MNKNTVSKFRKNIFESKYQFFYFAYITSSLQLSKYLDKLLLKCKKNAVILFVIDHVKFMIINY